MEDLEWGLVDRGGREWGFRSLRRAPQGAQGVRETTQERRCRRPISQELCGVGGDRGNLSRLYGVELGLREGL